MNNQGKRAEGAIKELGGKIQKKAGELLGDKKMEAEGTVNAVDGKVTQEKAKASERIKGKGEEIVGSIKRKVGAVISDTGLEAKGAAQKELGKARQAAND